MELCRVVLKVCKPRISLRSLILIYQEATLALVLLTVLLVRVPVSAQNDGLVDRPDGLCATFVLSQGLPVACEEYVVQTSDGFLLGVQRMYNDGEGSSTQKQPVFLYHGILAGGSSWLLNPPENSLPFMLAGAGYEVWIGNSRTTNYSSGHVTMSGSDKDYWDWSLDELAGIDVPAMVNLVSTKTSTAIHYVGFSQGTQAAVAAFSEGKVMSQINKVVLLAPVVYVSSVQSVMDVAAGLFLIDQMMLLAHVYEFDPNMASGQKLLDSVCMDTRCYNDYLKAFAGPNCCINMTRKDYFNDYGTEPTAMKNMAHLAQQIRTNSLAKYDYGFLKNLVVYHSIFPPSYDVSSIQSMPLLLIRGGSDALADGDDVSRFVQELTFTPETTVVPNYGHLDFLLGTTANVEVYNTVLTFLAT